MMSNQLDKGSNYSSQQSQDNNESISNIDLYSAIHTHWRSNKYMDKGKIKHISICLNMQTSKYHDEQRTLIDKKKSVMEKHQKKWRPQCPTVCVPWSGQHLPEWGVAAAWPYDAWYSCLHTWCSMYSLSSPGLHGCPPWSGVRCWEWVEWVWVSCSSGFHREQARCEAARYDRRGVTGRGHRF